MKTCIICEHWEFSGGERGYSRQTPGENWSSQCAAGRWEAEGYDEDRDSYRLKLLTAGTCPEYVLVKL